MSNNVIEMVFILDRSGSMGGLTQDTIGGFNSLIENQKKEEGKALVTTILFDHEYEVLHNGLDIQVIPPMTDKDYFARGMTGLLDAIGKSINTIDNRIKNLPDGYKPTRVVFVITTDGQENASKEYNKDQIKTMIENKQSKDDWTFMFLGANIDAIGEANNLGINSNLARNYTASNVGTASIYNSVSDSVSILRSNEGVLTKEVEKSVSACLDKVQ